MAFNGTGTFIRLYSWVQDALNGIKIRADRMDAETDGIATGLSTCITRDGQSPPTDDIPMGGMKLTGLGNGVDPTDAVAYGQLTTSLAALKGYLYGLTLSTAGASASFSVAAGLCVDSTGVLLMSLAAAMSKTTAAWVAGDTHGALDTGAIATNTWYHVFVIGDALQTPDILISISATAPTLPAGYTRFRRIGSMKTNGSSQWTKFLQYGDQFIWDVQVADASGTLSSVGVSLTISVPPGFNVLANLVLQLDVGAGSEAIYFTCPDQTNTAAGSATETFQSAASTAVRQVIPFNLMTNTSRQVRQRSESGLTTYQLKTAGWVDTRGK